MADLAGVLKKLKDLLKPGGAIYISFKEGDKEWTKDGRYFHNMTAEGCSKLLAAIGLVVVDVFETADVREGRSNELWVNVIGTKKR